MSTHLLKSPDTVSVTSTPQAVTLPETDCWYSIRNSGSGSVYYIAIDISDYTAATYTSATAAALRTAGCGMVASGESIAFKTDFPSIYLVCANGVTATANIEPGVISSVVNVEANLGNVGLLNAAEAEVNPATSDLQTTGNAILTTIDADTSKIPSQGTAIMAASMPVTIASDDALINVTKGAAYVTGGGSGQLLTCTNAATNYTATVVASAVYRVTATNGIIYLGIADSTSDANVLWTIPAGDTQIITIPSGTSLTYRSDAALVYGRLARIQ